MKRICTHRNKKQQKLPYLGTLIEKPSSKGEPAAYFEKKIMLKNSPD